MGLRDVLSAFLDEIVVRNEHLRRKGPKRGFIITFN